MFLVDMAVPAAISPFIVVSLVRILIVEAMRCISRVDVSVPIIVRCLVVALLLVLMPDLIITTRAERDRHKSF